MLFISSNSHLRRAGIISTTTLAAIGKKIKRIKKNQNHVFI
jgi:hypothetical protein